MAKNKQVSFLEPVRSAAVDYACPKCYSKMEGLTCEQHGTFVLCRRCGAAQTLDHKCLADQPVEFVKPKAKRKTQTRTFTAECIICHGKIIRGLFCSKDKKYQMRYHNNKKRGMSHEENVAKILQQANIQERVNGMLETAETADILELLK